MKLRTMAVKYGSQIAGVVGGVAVSASSFAVTTLTVLPAAAATATDSLIGAATDVGVILFAIGVPFTLAYLGWRVFHKSSNQATK